MNEPDRMPRRLTTAKFAEIRSLHIALSRERDALINTFLDAVQEHGFPTETLAAFASRQAQLEASRFRLWLALVDDTADHLAMVERLAAELGRTPADVSRLLFIELHAREYLQALRDDLGADWALRALRLSVEEVGP